MTPADQDVQRVVEAQARARGPVTAQQIVDGVRERMSHAPTPPGGPWTPHEVNIAICTFLAQQLLDERGERLRLGGRVHNLAGDFEELLIQWAADDLGDFSFVEQVGQAIRRLQVLADTLKAVPR